MTKEVAAVTVVVVCGIFILTVGIIYVDSRIEANAFNELTGGYVATSGWRRVAL